MSRHERTIEKLANCAAPFSLVTCFAHPGSFQTLDQNGPRKRIAIIGAGAAGLSAAFELESLGHHVEVFEAKNRVGGRILTHHFADGTHGELGAMRLAAHHGCVLHYVRKFSLPHRRFISFNPRAYLQLQGVRVRMDDPAPLWARYQLPLAEQRHPDALLDSVILPILNALTDAQRWILFRDARLDSLLRQLDERDYTEAFRQQLSASAFAMVGHATGMIHYQRVSLIEGLIDHLNWGDAEHLELIDGMAALTKAFATRIRGPMRLGTRVIAVELKDQELLIRFKQGAMPGEQHFDYAICTVPASAAANIAFSPNLPDRQTAALRGLTYSNAAKSLCHVKRRFWELEDGIVGGVSRTDSLIQQCYYPSDNVHAASGQSDSANPSCGPLRIAFPDLSSSPAALTAGYRWEETATRFARIAPQQRDEVTLQDLDTLHPGAQSTVDGMVHALWDEAVEPESGAYAFFRPGERERLQEALQAPFPEAAPRIFFAGEHIALCHASVQGAVQTALAAARAVAIAPCPIPS